MDNKAFYFPWVRKGLGGYINEKETLEGKAQGRPELTIRTNYTVQHNQQVEEEEEDVSTEMFLEKTVKFIGPGDILNVNPSAIMKVHPNDGSEEFATRYIPYIEFWEPDFLWRYTPAVHDDDKLRPWLALVACRKEDVRLMTDSEGVTYFTFIGDDKAWKRTFPNVEDLFRTAHAQGASKDKPDFCRLLGLRNGDGELDSNTEYLALLIPSYETGRRRGLGFGEEDIQKIVAQQPAWEPTLAQQAERSRGTEFPVYYKWSFKTKEETFDQLADALAPCSVSKSGLVLDVTDMGEGFSYNTVNHKGNRPSIVMPAATLTSKSPKQDAFPACSDGTDEHILYKHLEERMEASPVFAENTADRLGGQSFQEEGDDPWVTPPVYGARHAMTTGLDDPTNPKPWLREVNMDIHHRAAAGLGREVVQKHQEEFMDRAWKQVEAVQALNMELYKRLLSINTNKVLRNKTVDGFEKTTDAGADNARYIAYMMRYLSSMMNAGDSKFTLSSIIGNADIPASFAAPSFQNNMEKLSHIVAGLNPTSLMERIVKDQIFKFTSPDPAGSLDPDQLKQWCKDSIEALTYREFTDYWNPFYAVSADESSELRYEPRKFNLITRHQFLGTRTYRENDMAVDVTYPFSQIVNRLFSEDIQSGPRDYYGLRRDYVGDFMNLLRNFQCSAVHHRTCVYVIPDRIYDNWDKGDFGISDIKKYDDSDKRERVVMDMTASGELSLDNESFPVHSYLIPDDQFDRFFDKRCHFAKMGTGESDLSFMKVQENDPDVTIFFDAGLFHGHSLSQNLEFDQFRYEPSQTYSVPDPETTLRYYLYHLYHHKHLDTNFVSTIKRFVKCVQTCSPDFQYAAGLGSDLYGTDRNLPDPYSQKYKKDQDRILRLHKRYEKLTNFFCLKLSDNVRLYNNVKDGTLLTVFTEYLGLVWNAPALMDKIWESIMKRPTRITRLCYCSALIPGMLMLTILGAAGESEFESYRSKLNEIDKLLEQPSYIVVAQRYFDKNRQQDEKDSQGKTVKKSVREYLQVPRPQVPTLKSAITKADELKRIVAEWEKVTGSVKPEKPVDSHAVNELHKSIDNQGTDNMSAFQRIKEVASLYYQVFFSDKEEGTKLREDYLDKLLMSKYPILAYPFFPEPTYYYLKMLSDKFIIPGLEEIAPETVAMFTSNPQFTEAFLCGMNTEMGSELQWREYPTDRRGSYFRKFWDSESSVEAITGGRFFDVRPLHLWDSRLGENHLEGKGNLLIFAIHSKLLKLYPSTRIYLNKAVLKNESGTEVTFAKERKDPVMETFIREDLLLVGFDISLTEALGDPNSKNHGYMLTFEQDIDDLEFQYDDNNKNWRKNTSSDSAGNLIDTPSAFGKHVSLFINVNE